MGLLLSTRRAVALGGSYADKVLSYNPLAYWPLDEGGGTNARCLVNSAQNGTATGVTWANDSTGPFGTPAPYFDGANDYVNVHSPTFAAAWDGDEFTTICWAKVNAAGVWTDGANRRILNFRADGNNRHQEYKNAVNNQVVWDQVAAATAVSVTDGAMNLRAGADWFMLATTVSVTAGVMRAYLYGSGFSGQTGGDQAPLGNWAGPLLNTNTVIGAFSTAPANVWHGWLAHCAAWGSALPQATITALANP